MRGKKIKSKSISKSNSKRNSKMNSNSKSRCVRERGLRVRNRVAVERGIMKRFNCREVALHHAMATLYRGRCIELWRAGQQEC
jgi:hypothetical protein